MVYLFVMNWPMMRKKGKDIVGIFNFEFLHCWLPWLGRSEAFLFFVFEVISKCRSFAHHIVRPQFCLDCEILPGILWFFFNKSNCGSVWIIFLMVEMDSAPSRTLGAPKILKLDSCNQDFEKNSEFFQNPVRISIVFWVKLWLW